MSFHINLINFVLNFRDQEIKLSYIICIIKLDGINKKFIKIKNLYTVYRNLCGCAKKNQ